MASYLGVYPEDMANEILTHKTIARIRETVAAQILPVCLVVTGDDLGRNSLNF